MVPLSFLFSLDQSTVRISVALAHTSVFSISEQFCGGVAHIIRVFFFFYFSLRDYNPANRIEMAVTSKMCMPTELN